MSRLARLLGLGPSDEPRRVAVGARRVVTERPVVSTPGARVRISRDGRDGEIGRLLLWLHRRGEPVELASGENAVWLDGRRAEPGEVRAKLGRGR
jgi:hypothetical protein